MSINRPKLATPFEIQGTFDKNTLFCAGSVTKFLTIFVVLSFLAEKYKLNEILDDEKYLDEIATHDFAKNFLKLLQKKQAVYSPYEIYVHIMLDFPILLNQHKKQ